MRLSGLDVAFLCLDTPARPMHVGAVTVFAPDRPVDHDRLVTALACRAAASPRLDRRLEPVALPPGGARWCPDPRFDPAGHVRGYRVSSRSAQREFEAYAAGWLAAPLELSRPPWDLHVVSGLPDGRFALLLKLHHALADGASAVGIGCSLLDQAPPAGSRNPRPETEPPASGGDLLGRTRETLNRAGTMLLAARRPPVPALVSGRSAARRLAFVRLDACDVRQIRRRHGGTTNDIALAVLAGGLREWLLGRGQPVSRVAPRALIPVNTRARAKGRGAGNELSGFLCDLPVAEADPVARLRLVRAAMDRNKARGARQGAGAIPLLANLLPPAVHRLFTPLAGSAAPLLFDTVVTTVPLPPVPLTVLGAPLREVYPFAPLAAGHALGVSISPYRDIVHIGLQADREAAGDVEVLATCVAKAGATLHELCG